MNAAAEPIISEVLPKAAWDILEGDPTAVLVDVRTKSEWAFVGVPDLSSLGRRLLQVEWAQLPNMSQNPRFVGEVLEQLGDQMPKVFLFLCRSGVRSAAGARAVKAQLMAQGHEADCVNVLGGFEGDLDEHAHRGCVNGWKVEELPWRQS
ncbi:rhodanese-like domain-containing protein [Aliiroseovarius sp.]|uniref:rhodanese-like domain-containing protein n=1 Tax=Aliiroseovarius sp. TaxID=1872442 RepID=UPI003BADA565